MQGRGGEGTEHDKDRMSELPVVDGEGEIVSRRRQPAPASPDGGGGEVPGGHEGTLGYLGEHLGV